MCSPACDDLCTGLGNVAFDADDPPPEARRQITVEPSADPRPLSPLGSSSIPRRISAKAKTLRVLPPRLTIPLFRRDDDHRALAVARDLLRSLMKRFVDEFAQVSLSLSDLPARHRVTSEIS
jgi:hypothetical protein